MFIPSNEEIKNIVLEIEKDTEINQNVNSILDILKDNQEIKEKEIDIDNNFDSYILLEETEILNQEILLELENQNIYLENIASGVFVFLGLFVGLVVSITFSRVVFK